MFALLALLAGQDIAPPKIDPCVKYTGLGYAIGFRPAVPRQGDTVELIPMFVEFHGMPLAPVPSECATDWKVEGEGAKLQRDGTLQISASTVPGSEIKFSAQIGGSQGGRGYGSLKVIGAEQKVLSGKFGIAERGICVGNAAEIAFSASGYYTYTRPEDMFETKVSGSGQYTWDEPSGRLVLFHDDGRVYQRGTARWVDSRLVLDDIDPGGPMIADDPSIDASGPHCHLVLAGG